MLIEPYPSQVKGATDSWLANYMIDVPSMQKHVSGHRIGDECCNLYVTPFRLVCKSRCKRDSIKFDIKSLVEIQTIHIDTC